MDLGGRITRDPGICGGESIIKGTRVPVRIILANLAEGVTVDQILEFYPTLQAQDVYAVIQSFAKEAVHGKAA